MHKCTQEIRIALLEERTKAQKTDNGEVTIQIPMKTALAFSLVNTVVLVLLN